MFTNRVANVGPGETVLIRSNIQAPVRRGGKYSLRLPLVVGPRYVSPRSVVDRDGGINPPRWRSATAPLAHPSLRPGSQPGVDHVDLQPGFPIAT